MELQMNRTIIITTETFNYFSGLENYNVILNPYSRKLSESEVNDLFLKYDPIGMIAGVEPLTRNNLKNAHSLKVISRCGIGMDSIEMQATSDLGIKVINTPEAPTESVAEYALTLILSLLRKITYFDKVVKNNTSSPKMKGCLLKDKKVGIVGCGRIGTRLAELITPFGAQILGYDPFLETHKYCKLVSFDELFSTCDVISLHLPLNTKTKGIINKQVLSLMKQNVILINTARGLLINEDDLFESLSNNSIGGAGLDVFCEEPYKGKLITLGDKVLLSPHQGSNTVEGRARMERESVTNLLELLQ